MKSNSLFELIRSLTKHEKGYFRKFSRIYSTEGDKNYIELFDFIEKMETYDEKAIRTEFKNTPWIKHLPVLKKYLFTQILKSLELYQRAGKKDENFIFRQVEILIERGLYKEASNMLRDGQETAEASENYYSLLDSYDKERRIINFLYTPTEQVECMDRLYHKQQKAADIIGGLFNIKKISDELRDTYRRRGVIRDEKLILEIDEFVTQKLLPVLDLYPSVSYRHIAFSAVIVYYAMKGDAGVLMKYTSEHLEMMDQNQKFFDGKPLYVMSIYFNYLSSCNAMSKFEEFNNTIKLLEAVVPNNGLVGHAFKFKLLFNLYFTYITSRKAYPLVFQYLYRFEKEFKLYKTVLHESERVNLASKLAYLLFLNGKMQEAVDWIDYCMSIEKAEVNDFLASQIRLLDLILHFELKNFRLLESKVLSAKRHMERNKIFFRSEHIIVSYLVQLSKADGTPKSRTLFAKFHKDLYELYDNHPTERAMIHELGLLQWIEKKVDVLAV